jgi:hypothetical protein
VPAPTIRMGSSELAGRWKAAAGRMAKRTLAFGPSRARKVEQMPCRVVPAGVWRGSEEGQEGVRRGSEGGQDGKAHAGIRLQQGEAGLADALLGGARGGLNDRQTDFTTNEERNSKDR